MSWADGVRRRGERAVEERRQILMGAVARRLRDMPGIAAAEGGGDIEISGRGLLRRWLEDAELRFAGRAR